MSDNLPQLLAELSQLAPDVCQKDRYLYIIDEYAFFISNDKFQARQSGEFMINPVVTGQPALDWLHGCLMRVIEGKGWVLDTCQLATHNGCNAIVDNDYNSDWQPTMAEALLTALIMAIKGESE